MKRADSYHHGDLMAELIRPGLEALADEDNRVLYEELSQASATMGSGIPAMGKADMDFAVAHPALRLLGESLAAAAGHEGELDPSSAAAAWGFIHGLVLLRIGGLYPRGLPGPDWDYLSSMVPMLPPPRG